MNFHETSTCNSLNSIHLPTIAIGKPAATKQTFCFSSVTEKVGSFPKKVFSWQKARIVHLCVMRACMIRQFFTRIREANKPIFGLGYLILATR